MIARVRSGLVAAGLVFLGVIPALAQAPTSGEEPANEWAALDPSTGEIDGKRALAIYAVRYEGSSAAEILHPPGCEVRMVKLPRAEDGAERPHPCGEWFLEEAGYYLYWIETSDWQISPFSRKVIYTARPFEGRGFPGAAPLGPAGRIVLPENIGQSARYQLRLLHAEPDDGGLPGWEMTRRIATDRIGEGILMPAGPTVGSLWDTRSNRYVMLSHPFEIEYGQTSEVPLEEPPVDRAQLVVQILRNHKSASKNAPVDMDLVEGERKLKPDFEVPLRDHIYAIWYDLQPGKVEIRAGTETDVIVPITLELQVGTIERVSGQLEPRPDLEVELAMPSMLRAEKTALEIRRLPSKEVVTRRELAPDTWSERFEGLPRAPLELEFQSTAGSVLETVDLSNGEDGFVHLELDPVIVTGHVRLGGEPHPATLTFTTVQRQSAAVATDDEGWFEYIALRPLRSVSIELNECELAPFVEFFPKTITGTTERDFVIPDNRFTLRVIDAVSGQPIAGAHVAVRNHYDPDEEAGKYGMAVMQSVVTDKEGVARLPPLRAGKLEAQASADGYARMQEPSVSTVLEGVKGAALEIVLEPLGESAGVRLALPSGAPAENAHVALLDSLANGSILFESTADSAGTVTLPREKRGVVLVRHDNAAFLVRSWPPQPGDTPNWELPSAPSRPLVVRVLDPTGEEAVRRAGITLWVDGWRLSGIALFWLTGARDFADENGFWSAANVPPGPVSILASGFPGRASMATGAWDMLATEIAAPWPEVVEVRAVRLD